MPTKTVENDRGAHSHRKRREYPRYTPIGLKDGTYGDPYEIFGIDFLYGQYTLDRQVYTVKAESVIGRLKVGSDVLPLTARIKRRAIRMIQHDENNLATGKVLYILYPEIYPYSTLHLEGVPIEQIDEDWPEGVEFPEGSLVHEIMKPEAKTLAVSIEALWRERGGDPKRKFSKKGGRKFKDV